ncbi:hypothetical protein LJC04_02515 [Ruminococcaceae bacterium OttesenSCG-928-O06]|nr:hypothetical protein [Ruminococcaceae bacterium OttesenSCG-928-O06]
MQEYSFRLAGAADEAAIRQFVRTHWESRHPLVELPDFFAYYYKIRPGQLNFALCERGDALCAVAGFVYANQCEAPDVWVSLWVADKAASGSGLELMEALPRLCGCRTLACNNIRPETRPFYHFLGFTTGRVAHYYRLAQRARYTVARVENPRISPVGGAAQLTLLPNAAALATSGFVPPKTANPCKDLWYIARRYFAFPRQEYRLYAAALPGAAPCALLAARVVPVNGTNVLRLVDYIGPAGFLPEMGAAIQTLLDETGAEYADLYCAGLPEDVLYKAGFVPRAEGDESVVIPNYLTPLVRENVEYYYFTNRPEGFCLFRADGDQDRPHTPLP